MDLKKKKEKKMSSSYSFTTQPRVYINLSLAFETKTFGITHIHTHSWHLTFYLNRHLQYDTLP